MATRNAVAGSASWASRCVASSSRTATSIRPLSTSSSHYAARRNQRTYTENDDVAPETMERSDPSSSRRDTSYDRSASASSETPAERSQKLTDKYYAHAHPGWKSTYGYAVLPDPPPLPKTHGIHVATLRMTAHEIQNLEFYAQWCYLSARSFGMPARRPERLPRTKELITVLKGPFVHKKFQENFAKITYKREIRVYDTSRETLDLWLRYISRNAMGGLTIKVRVHEWVNYGWGKKDIEAVEAQFDGVSGKSEDAIRRRAYELVKQMAGKEEADKMLKAVPLEAVPEVEEEDFIKSDSVGSEATPGNETSSDTAAVQAEISAQAESITSEEPAPTMSGESEDVAETSSREASSTLETDTITPTSAEPALAAEVSSTATSLDLTSPTTTVVSGEEKVVEVAPALDVSQPTTGTLTSESSSSESTTEIPSPAASESSSAPSPSSVKLESTFSTADRVQSSSSANSNEAPESPSPSATSAPPPSPPAAEETVEERSKAETESAISDASPDEPVFEPKPRKTRAKTTKKAETVASSTVVEPAQDAESVESAPKKRITQRKKAEPGSDAEPAVDSAALETAAKKRTRTKKIAAEKASEENAAEASAAEKKTAKKRVTKKQLAEEAKAAEGGKVSGIAEDAKTTE